MKECQNIEFKETWNDEYLKVQGKVQGKLLELIQETPEITALQLADRLGMSERTIRKQIAELRKNSMLKRIGSDKTGHWEVLSTVPGGQNGRQTKQMPASITIF